MILRNSLIAISCVPVPGVVIAQATDTARVVPVVVTATRTAVPLAAAPATVTVLSGDRLRAEGITQVAEALLQVPGVAVAQTGSFGGTTSLFLRGGESKYAKVLVDGVPMNAPGGTFDFGSLTIDNIDRIEIVRGPASVLYGSDAVTGVIQIFTRRGAGPPQVTVDARAGTYGTTDASAALAGGAGTMNYSFDVARHATNGIYAFNNQFINNVVSGLVRFRPDLRTDAHLALRYTNFDYHYPTNSAGQPVDSGARNGEDNLALSFDVGRAVLPHLDARLFLATHDVDGTGEDQPSSPGDTTGYYYTSLDHLRRRSADARLMTSFFGANTFSLGAQIEQEVERSLSEGNFGQFPVNSVFEASRQNRALYAQLLSERENVSVVIGGRYENNERFGHFATYRAGVNYALLPDTRLRASAGTAFREPTFYENFASGFVTGNPALHPERTVSWEAAIDQRLLDSRLSFGATYFHQRFRDLIDYLATAAPGKPNYLNVGTAEASGLELESRFAPLSGFDYSATFTHLDTRVVDPGFDTTAAATFVRGARLLRRPATAAGAGVGWRMVRRGSVNLRLTYVGRRDDRDFSAYPARAVVLPDYLTVDFAAEVSLDRVLPAHPGTAATLRIDNMTGRRYQSVYNYASPGRVVLLGARYVF